ncbi:MAG: HlyD family efflux transporter periplasmic adaptor subunit [Dehalococcoidia bacterium]
MVRRHWLLLIAGLALVAFPLTACRTARIAQGTANLRTETVRRSTFQVSVLASGNTVFSKQAKLSFGSAGTVSEVRVRVGQQVGEGEVLARLDTRDLEVALLRAQQDLKNAERAMQDYLDSFSETRVAQARAAAEMAKANLANAEEAYAKAQSEATLLAAQAQQRVADARLGVQRAQEALEKARQPYSQEDLARSKENVELARSGLQTAQRSLQLAEMDLDITRKDWANRVQDAQNQVEANERTYTQTFLRTYRSYLAVDTSIPPHEMLGVQPSGVDSAVLQAWNTLTSSRNNLEVLKAQAQRNILNAENALQRARDAVKTAQQNLIDAEKRLADMLSPPDPLDIEAKERALVAAQAAVREAEEDLDKMKPDPLEIEAKERALATAQEALRQAEADLARAKDSANAILAQRAAQVASARAALASAQEDLEKLLKGPDPATLEARRLQVEIAKASLADAQRRLENATLKAPFAGVIAQVQAEAGVQIGASTIAVEVIDPSQVEIQASVDETDVARLRFGQEAQVSVEALGQFPLRGRIVSISPVARVQQGVVSYDVTLALTIPQTGQTPGAPPQAGSGQRPPPGAIPSGGAGRTGQRPPSGAGTPASSVGAGFLAVGLREGMTVSARIIVEQKEGVLVVPARAVRTEGGKRVVEVVQADGKRVLKEVQVGTSGDQGVEIIAGLQEGETVVVPTATGQRTTTQPTFRGGVGPGGFGVR